ncbi:DNA primase family protein [Clostridium butyricum]
MNIKKLNYKYASICKLNKEGDYMENIKNMKAENKKDEIRTIKVQRINDEPQELQESIYDNENDLEKKQKKKKSKEENNIYRENESKKEMTISSKGRRRLNVTKLAEMIVNENKFIYINGKIYKYIDKMGYFHEVSNHELDTIIFNSLNPKILKWTVYYDISSIREFIILNKQIQFNEKIKNNKFYINCLNGVINLKTMKLKEHDPEKFFMNVINAKYDCSIEKKEFKKTCFSKFIEQITDCDDELINLIQEVMGYTLSNINNAKKFFILYGVSNSGKSTLLDLLEYMIGKENISNVPLQNLSDEKYCAVLYNKLANIYNELPDYGIRDLGQIKALVSESDTVNARNLYGNPFSFKNRAKLMFATNNLPKLITRAEHDNSAFFNRILIIPFEISIKEKDQNKNLSKLMKKEVDIIFKWCLLGVKRYIDNGFEFSKCRVSEKYCNIYRENEDIIGEFIKKNIKLADGKVAFWKDIECSLKEYAKYNGKNNITKDEYIFAKELICKKFNTEYKKIHTNLQNRWGFRNIELKI